MNTTITSAVQKADLVEARNEWDARNAEQKAKHGAQYEVYKSKCAEVYSDIKAQVLDALSGIETDLKIRVDSGFSFSSNRAEVSVSNEHDRSENQALRWDWKVSLDESGNPKFESSSWSGLQVTTIAQVKSLKESMRAIEVLMGFDWQNTLSVALPEYKDYVTEHTDIGKRPDFEGQLFDLEIAELIGANTLIKGASTGGGRGRGRGTSWYLIVGESPKQFKVAEISSYSTQPEYLERCGKTLPQIVEQASNWTSGISKEKLKSDIICRPLETLAF